MSDYRSLLPSYPAIRHDANTIVEAILSLSRKHPWTTQLLAVLPLATLLDLVDIDRKLHIFQLVGAVPLWSWTVTPGSIKTLLAEPSHDGFNDDNDEVQLRPCHMDAFGQTMQWMATDGRHGAHYVVANPETLRRCLSASPSQPIVNRSAKLKSRDAETHHLEVIRVSSTRTTPRSKVRNPTGGLPLAGFLLDSWRRRRDPTSFYTAVVVSGWILIVASIGAAVFLECFWGASYLANVCLTGLCIQLLHGGQSRRLHPKLSGYNRMIMVSQHSNATSWKVFYGDSAILNALLRLPLKCDPSYMSPVFRSVLRFVLRLLSVVHWGTALGAAVAQGWDAVFVCSWVLFSTITTTYLLPPTVGAKIWMPSFAGVVMERYPLKLSSRRSLLSTLLALNPDTTPLSSHNRLTARYRDLDRATMSWLDTMWKDGPSRRSWEEALRKALTETFQNHSVDEVARRGHEERFWEASTLKWQAEWDGASTQGSEAGYDDLTDPSAMPASWLPCIHEGLNMAARVQAEAERLVVKAKSARSVHW